MTTNKALTVRDRLLSPVGIARLLGLFLALAILSYWTWSTLLPPPRQPALEAWLSDNALSGHLAAQGVERIAFRCPVAADMCSAHVSFEDASKLRVPSDTLPDGIRHLSIQACDASCDGFTVKARVDESASNRRLAQAQIGVVLAHVVADVRRLKANEDSWAH